MKNDVNTDSTASSMQEDEGVIKIEPLAMEDM